MLPKMVMKNSETPDKGTHHHFFKIVHPDQLTTQHLRIPSKFMKHISGKSYEGVILEGPNGRHWHAKLCRTRDGTYIREGWNKFVTDHSLMDNELLVFKYDGDMFFKIQIFNKNGCERENVYTSNETHQEPIVEKRKPGRPPKRKVDSCSSQKQGTSDNTSADYSGDEQGRHGTAKKKAVSRSGKEHTPPKKNASLEDPSPSTACKGNLGKKIKIEDEAEAEAEDEDDSLPIHESDTIGDEDDSLPIHEMDTKTTHCLSSRRTSRTETDEDAKLWKAVESFSSSRPYFIRHLRTRTVWRNVYVPAGFCKEHFPRHAINIILRNQKGKAWTVRVCYSNDRYNFSGGWPAFVHANKLQKGDICIYELVGKLEFCVHIFRLLKKATICVL